MIDIDAPLSNQFSCFPFRFSSSSGSCSFLVWPACRSLLPLFEPSDEQRLESSSLQNWGFLEWIPQWMCVLCNIVVRLAQAHDGLQVVCSQCGAPCPTLVVVCFCGTRWVLCARCRKRVKFSSAIQHAQRSIVPNWFLHGQLSTTGSHFGWGESPITPSW